MFNEKAVLAEIGKINEATKDEVSWMRKGTTECEAEIATISPELGAIITTLRIRLRETSGKLLSLSFLHMVRDHALDTTSELYAAMNEEVVAEVVAEVATAKELHHARIAGIAAGATDAQPDTRRFFDTLAQFSSAAWNSSPYLAGLDGEAREADGVKEAFDGGYADGFLRGLGTYAAEPQWAAFLDGGVMAVSEEFSPRMRREIAIWNAC